MTKLNFALKKIIDESLESYGLSEYELGTVVSSAPIKIKTSDRVVLEADQLLLTEQVIEKVIKINHNHMVSGSTGNADGHTHGVNITSQDKLENEIVITEGLKVNDKVILISAEQGQKYIVLSKQRDCNKISIDGNSGVWSLS